jgi:YD repeat-containing protein
LRDTAGDTFASEIAENLQLRVDVRDAFNAWHIYSFDRVNGVLKLRLQSTDGLGGESRNYDANGNPASYTNRRGMVTSYTYDSVRNLETSRTEAYGTALARTITTTWHATYRQPATITEPSGVAGVNLVTEFTHDAAGNVTKKKLTAGTKIREWNYTYNARGQVLTVDGPRTDVTDVTTYTYYADNDSCVGCRGQVHTVTNAASQVTTFNSYNADSRPTQVTDPNGVATTLAYKARGWLESRTVGGETTTYDYDNVGNVTRVTMPDGSWVGYAYDDAHGLTAVEDNLGNSIEYELDVLGNRVQEVVYDAQGTLRKTLQRLYDAYNRLERDLGALGQATRYTYDAYGNALTVADPLNRTTTNTYDILSRLTNVNDPANGNTVFTYDAKDRLKTVKDPKLSATTTYNYNGLGDLESQVSPDTGTTSFTHDAAGNVATQTDARSVESRDRGHRHRRHGELRIRQHHHRRGLRQGAAHEGDRSLGQHDVRVRQPGARDLEGADHHGHAHQHDVCGGVQLRLGPADGDHLSQRPRGHLRLQRAGPGDLDHGGRGDPDPLCGDLRALRTGVGLDVGQRPGDDAQLRRRRAREGAHAGAEHGDVFRLEPGVRLRQPESPRLGEPGRRPDPRLHLRRQQQPADRHRQRRDHHLRVPQHQPQALEPERRHDAQLHL